MPVRKKTRTNKRNTLERAALVASAGIAAATALVTSNDALGADPMRGSMAQAPGVARPNEAMARKHITLSSDGVSFHSEAIAKHFARNPAGVAKVLQRYFPGITVREIRVGKGGTIFLHGPRDSVLYNQGYAGLTMNGFLCFENFFCMPDIDWFD